MSTSVLAFDCAVTGLAVAVMRDGAVLDGRRLEGRDQAATLMPAIAASLQAADVGRRSLSLIAVTIGPGSFTGVRVGLAAARGLAIALDVPLAGLATTDVLLAQAVPAGRVRVAAIDSKLGDWFCAIDGGAPFLASADNLDAKLGGKACVIVGPDADRLAAKVRNAVAQAATIDPATIARLALAEGTETWRRRNEAEGLPRPLYLRGVNITTPDGSRRTVD